ncbi:ATP-dependent zinc metalloprotease YME1 -like protein [Sarcoptes scabiei]|uniref:ATP-dependent zinc metalloprotease YME1 -like protein n=1 Tax=Sarcoptes scabiei TaxID=52283 RepID=A0A132AD74_SARSC|nr:ATP-dependent zinc metalloprotease YME1 -like protein [Sarcoptes scabiei]KPM08883.1 ATP-dependent zinc metalloprotease YME1-like protein [Sarcoptes scabiei]
MSLNVNLAGLMNLNCSQVLPSLTHVHSLLKRKPKTGDIKVPKGQCEIEPNSIKIVDNLLKKIIDEKHFDNVIKKFTDSTSISINNDEIKFNFCADLSLIDPKSSLRFHRHDRHHKIVVNLKNNLLCIDNHRFRMIKHHNQQRCFHTRPNYIGIGNNPNRRFVDRGSLNLKLGSLFKRRSVDDTDKLKSLFNDEKLSEEEKNRIKVAFAEGYSAADPKNISSKKLRFFNVFRDLLGIIFIIVILTSFMGETSGGTLRRVLFGDSNEVLQEEIDVTFNDVKGVDEAKQELMEVVEFLKNPTKFSSLGGKLPKGVLLVGPPGTGKTLLARAVAGEAGVPFFHTAGPEFDEILVGQGAKRVRDLFATAKQKAPCVIFIDEIDSIGAKRSNSVLHPYANQTINQLLTEMDGFRQNEGVIVLGATNRRDDLDKALIRPGRFDVEIQVSLPDFEGRRSILQLYLGKIKYSSDVDLDVLARGTVGFTGADLENLINQAAIRAVIDGLNEVPMDYFENSRDKVLMGPEKKSRIPDEEANKITAYHEAGHALVAFYTKDSHPLHKVTIIPRGPSLGHTAYIPEKESYHITKGQMLAMMDTLMGGRVAEELVFGPEKITTGASSDLKKATKMATSMVKDWGMSEKIGVRTFDDEHNSLVVMNELANSTTETIDNEIKRILQESYDRAKNILKSHSHQHAKLAEALLKHETLNGDEIKQLLAN